MPAQEVPVTGFGGSRGWWLATGGLAVWHLLLTLALFGNESQSYPSLMDERPILSGRHALHLYHGSLGAQEFSRTGRFAVYDPAYHAGYPKTPWFDAGSKPAELFQYLAGSRFSPPAYKLGVALSWAMIPLVLALAAWAAGLNPAAVAFATLAAVVVCWSDCGRELLGHGDLDFILSGTAAALAFGLAIAYQTRANVAVWFALTVAMAATVFFQVLVPLVLIPVILVYYFTAGWQQKLSWHLGLAVAFLTATIPNALWLGEALATWWIRNEVPTPSASSGPLAFFRFLTEHRLGTNPMLLATLLGLTLGAAIGTLGLSRRGNGLAARVLALACGECLLLGGFGPFWQSSLGFAADRFLFVGLLFACPLTGQAVVSLFDVVSKVTGTNLRGAAVTCALLAAVIIGCHVPLTRFVQHTFRHEPLPVGLPLEVQESLQVLSRDTAETARILWEETESTDRWSPLLAQLTGRSYLGGLGPDAAIEHTVARLRDGKLAGRPLSEWTDLELADFARRFNLGWIVCRSEGAKERFKNWSVVATTTPLPDQSVLLTLRRPFSYALAGKARVIEVQANQITLADVQPADGVVVLSFHFHPGVVPSADRVQIEKEPHLYDGISLIRLRMNAPLARLTLRWSE